MRFINKLCCSLAVFAITLLVVLSDAAAAGLSIPVGRSELIEIPVEMSEVIVANPEIADVYVHGKKSVSVIGKGLGVTVVKVFDKQNKMIRSVDVTVGYDLPSIRKALKDFLPYEGVDVNMVNSNIALTGEVGSVSSAERAVKIVEEFVSPAYGPDAKDGGDKEEASKILNLLSVTGGQQVMLRVRVGEIRRTTLKNLGVNLQALKSNGSAIFQLGTGAGTNLYNTLATGGGVVGSFGSLDAKAHSLIGLGGNNFAGVLDALEENGLFKTLAEPTLVAMSGEEARFLAGGEFPIPVAQDVGSISIQYKPFGVSVSFKPFVLSENRIRIAVEPEVSEISDDATLEISGFSIPSLTTRRAETTVELAPGESFMIAGLIQDKVVSTISQLPGVGEIPILSALFRSTSFQRQETELVLAVTPYLVDPMASGDVKLPTDDFRAASVMESFFYGALGASSEETQRLSQTPQAEGPIGFMVD
jgi:pilus assembly protein CpaC